MKHLLLFPLVVTGTLVLALSGSSQAPPGPPREAPASPGAAPPGRHALLVACTTYPHARDTIRELKGPANDVVLLAGLLRERFGFTPKDIVTLCEAAGGEHTPTRAHIEREFQRLARTARKGDQVVILLGGHGSQVPDRAPQDEQDGLDEAFLPADVEPFDARKGAVPGAIRDDELGAWTRAIADRGAHVWVICDFCHSGSGLRSLGEDDPEVPREVLPKDLGIPREVLDAARREALARAEGTRPGQRLKEDASLEGIAVLYASQALEPTFEKPLPPGSRDQKVHGLLTYAVCELLASARSPMSYRQLADRVTTKYHRWNRSAGPYPFAEGSDVDRGVLGQQARAEAGVFLLLPDAEEEWKVTGGRLHGLTEDSILAVYPPAGEPGTDRVLGHVQVTRSNLIDAIVTPCDHAGMKAPGKLVRDCRCKLVQVDLALTRLAVALERPAKQVEARLGALASKPESLITLVESPGSADWVVQSQGNQLRLLPAAAARYIDQGEIPPGTPIIRCGEEDAGAKLEQLARAQSLLKLADAFTQERHEVPGREYPVSLKVETLRFKGPRDLEGEVVHDLGPTHPLKHGEYIGWRITNTGRVPVDVTLLFIDSKLCIQALHPAPGKLVDNRLAPGRSLTIGPGCINAEKSVGTEHVVVIGVEGQGPPFDLAGLADSSVDRFEKGVVARSAEEGKTFLSSPLGQLMKTALYGKGTTRGFRTDVLDRHTMHLVTWQVAPVEKQ